MSEDPKERIFDSKIKENYIELKCLIKCHYNYSVISDLGKDLNRENLFKYIMDIFKITERKKIDKLEWNWMG